MDPNLLDRNQVDQTDHVVEVERGDGEEEEAIHPDQITDIRIQVVSATLPTKRLARRIKLWNISSGWSINEEEEVNQLILDLQHSNDLTLSTLADADRGCFNHWSDVTALLNDKEFQMASVSGADNNVNPTEFLMEVEIAFTLDTGTTISKYILININNTSEDMAAAIQNIILEHYEISLEEVLGRFSGHDSLHHQVFECLGKDLGFAEDVILYQEEIISLLRKDKNDYMIEMDAKMSHLISEHKREIDEYTSKIDDEARERDRIASEEKKRLSLTHDSVLTEQLAQQTALFNREKAELISKYEAEKLELVSQHKSQNVSLLQELQTTRQELQNHSQASARLNSNNSQIAQMNSQYELKIRTLEEHLDRASHYIEKLTNELKFLNESMANNAAVESCYIFAPEVKERIAGGSRGGGGGASNSNVRSTITDYEFRPPPAKAVTNNSNNSNNSNINNNNNNNNNNSNEYSNEYSNYNSKGGKPSLNDFDLKKQRFSNIGGGIGIGGGGGLYNNSVGNQSVDGSSVIFNPSSVDGGMGNSTSSGWGGQQHPAMNNSLEDYFGGRVHVNTTFVSPLPHNSNNIYNSNNSNSSRNTKSNNNNDSMSSSRSVSSVSIGSYSHYSRNGRNEHPLRQAFRSRSAQKQRERQFQANDGLSFSFGTNAPASPLGSAISSFPSSSSSSSSVLASSGRSESSLRRSQDVGSSTSTSGSNNYSSSNISTVTSSGGGGNSLTSSQLQVRRSSSPGLMRDYAPNNNRNNSNNSNSNNDNSLNNNREPSSARYMKETDAYSKKVRDDKVTNSAGNRSNDSSNIITSNIANNNSSNNNSNSNSNNNKQAKDSWRMK